MQNVRLYNIRKDGGHLFKQKVVHRQKPLICCPRIYVFTWTFKNSNDAPLATHFMRNVLRRWSFCRCLWVSLGLAMVIPIFFLCHVVVHCKHPLSVWWSITCFKTLLFFAETREGKYRTWRHKATYISNLSRRDQRISKENWNCCRNRRRHSN